MAIISPSPRVCGVLLLSLAINPVSFGQDSTSKTTSSDELVDSMITALDPCAGSPNEAVCRCALEFPPVTYDEYFDNEKTTQYGLTKVKFATDKK